jgi:hypothetical protein
METETDIFQWEVWAEVEEKFNDVKIATEHGDCKSVRLWDTYGKHGTGRQTGERIYDSSLKFHNGFGYQACRLCYGYHKTMIYKVSNVPVATVVTFVTSQNNEEQSK